MPRNTKLHQVFEMLQTDNGATTREIMDSVGINDARSVRRTINTIRRKLGDCSFGYLFNSRILFVQLNFLQSNINVLNGYKIPKQVEKEISRRSYH